MSAEKLFRTVLTIEVLSNERVDMLDLEEINYRITEGDASGVVDIASSEEVSRERMAELLIAQGSDPSFLLGDSDDDDDDDDDEIFQDEEEENT